MAVSQFELLRRRTEGGDEFCVKSIEILADRSAEGVKAWGRRPRRAPGLGRRVLPQDGLGPERLLTAPLPLRLGLRFDRPDQRLHLAAVLLGREMVPAGQRFQGER